MKSWASSKHGSLRDTFGIKLYRWQNSIAVGGLPDKEAQVQQENWEHLACGNGQGREWGVDRSKEGYPGQLVHKHFC